MDDSTEQFDVFVREHGPGLFRALVAGFGPVVGNDATQSALEYGWEHWPEVSQMRNPGGYLYRVAQSAAVKDRRRPLFDSFVPAPDSERNFEPGLIGALRELTDHQRTAVLLVHGHGYRLAEAADALGVSVSTVRNHLNRGLEKLRSQLGAEHVS